MPWFTQRNLQRKKKTCISVSALFSHPVLPTWEFTCTHVPEHTLTLTLPLGGRCVQLCACVRISWHMGQSDVPSHICQHPLFIYLVILSYVDPVTWSEGGRCGATGTPGSPVRTWWETRVCDLARAHTHTHTTKHSHKDLHNKIASFRFQIPIFPPTLTLYRALIEIL